MTAEAEAQRMSSDYEDESPEKCRERRRRRMNKRRIAAMSAASSCPQPLERNKESLDCVGEVKRIRTNASASSDGFNLVSVPASDSVACERLPVYGTMSISGRPRQMEDAFHVRMRLCRPEICRRRPVHFFAVFDGHGGPHVAKLCSEKMHLYLEEELMRVAVTGDTESGGDGGGDEEEEVVWRKAMERSFQRMDELALGTCTRGTCHPMEVGLSGSTAVVSILTPGHIIVGNCGDSRAVLCRGGRAIPLSFDHKPDRPDDRSRIEALGSRVTYANGARVEGILAMSRAIGLYWSDLWNTYKSFCKRKWQPHFIGRKRPNTKHNVSMRIWLTKNASLYPCTMLKHSISGDNFLKPAVSSEPEITFTKRDPEDECLILASDGLWDVLSSNLACEIASQCLRDGSPTNTPVDLNNTSTNVEGTAFYPSQSLMAAALLTRLALGRKSDDNITVMIVDLKRSLRAM